MDKRNSKALLSQEVHLIQTKLKELGKIKTLNIFNLLLFTGVRASEYSKAVEFANKGISNGVISTKKAIKRLIFIPHNLLNINLPLLKRTALFNTIQKIPNLVGLERDLSPHDLRATAITALDNEGISPISIQQWSGHERLESILAYIRRNPTRIKETSNILHQKDWSKIESGLYNQQKIEIIKKEFARFKEAVRDIIQTKPQEEVIPYLEYLLEGCE